MKNSKKYSLTLEQVKNILLFSLLFLLSQVFVAYASYCQSTAAITAESLFSIMETKAEQIDSIVVNVSLHGNNTTEKVKLLIKSPNKFAIIFNDNSLGVYFNGSSLWFYISQISEAFYYIDNANSSYLSYLPLLSPKKIFTSLTKKTLFSLFNVQLTNSKLISADTKSGRKLVYYTLMFTPKMKTIFKQIFSVGHYLMVFSNKTYLPVELSEYSPSGDKRGSLTVNSYSINTKIDDEVFNFSPPEGTILTPITVIIARKIEEYGGVVVKKVSSYADRLKNKLMNWSF